MNTRRTTPLFLTTLGIAGLLMGACAKEAAVQPKSVTVVLPAAPAHASEAALAAPPNAAVSVLMVNPDAASAWSAMKDLTFDQRPAFLNGLNGLEAIVDAEISGLNARRSAMTTDIKDWDFEMKGLVDDQSYLKGLNAEVATVEPENWDQEREKVEGAWQNTQEAYGKVVHSTTER